MGTIQRRNNPAFSRHFLTFDLKSNSPAPPRRTIEMTFDPKKQ